MSDSPHGPDQPPDSRGGPEDFVRGLVRPPAPLGAYRELGVTPLARRLGLPEDQQGGHWCSRCSGVWYGCALEVECPVCGNRNG